MVSVPPGTTSAFLQERREKDIRGFVFLVIKWSLPENVCLLSHWPEPCHVMTPGSRGVWVKQGFVAEHVAFPNTTSLMLLRKGGRLATG